MSPASAERVVARAALMSAARRPPVKMSYDAPSPIEYAWAGYAIPTWLAGACVSASACSLVWKIPEFIDTEGSNSP